MKMQFRSISCHHLHSFYQFKVRHVLTGMAMCVLSRALRGSHDEHEIPGWLFYTGGSTTSLL